MLIFKSRSDSFWTFYLLQFLCFLSLSNSLFSRDLVEFPGNSLTLDRPRMKRNSEIMITDCMTVTSAKGHYFFRATREWLLFHKGVCGVYLMADPDEVIQVHFDHIQMPCDGDGVISFVDGWELNGAYFPSDEDHPKSAQNRVREFCGWKRPKEVFQSSQNAALIRFRAPMASMGFSFYVTTHKNPIPCNILVDSSNYIYTLRNYGHRMNCSLLAMNPAKLQILSLTVGINNFEKSEYTETGTFHNCDKNGIQDYVQIGGGTDLSQFTVITDSICGIQSTPGQAIGALLCGITKVRLVSSGNANNIITLTVDKADPEEAAKSDVSCL